MPVVSLPSENVPAPPSPNCTIAVCTEHAGFSEICHIFLSLLHALFRVPAQLDAIPPLPELMPQTCPPDQIPTITGRFDWLTGTVQFLGYDNNKVRTTECQHLLQHAAELFSSFETATATVKITVIFGFFPCINRTFQI